MSNGETEKTHELTGIEILRFICALAVIIWHYQQFFFRGAYVPELGASIREALPLHTAFSVFYNMGDLAVPFFWVISGFIFYWHYAQSIASGTTSFTDFAVRRFSRLYPLHFVTLIAVALLQLTYFESHGETFIYSGHRALWFVSQLLFATNWLTKQPLTFNGPIWSVSVELLIYLAFFTIARLLGPRAIFAALLAAAFSIGYNFLHGAINPPVFACGMYFFAGGVAQRLASYRVAPAIAGCVVVSVLAFLIFGRHAVTAPYLLPLAMGVVIVMTRLGESVLRSPFQHLAFLGNATYSSYLIHFPLQLVLVLGVDALGWSRDIFYRPAVFIAFLLSVAGLALLVHRYFEMPAQSYLRRLAKRSTVMLRRDTPLVIQ